MKGGPFALQIWRFAWARAGYARGVIGGWRRVLGRLWWRLPPAPLPPEIVIPAPDDRIILPPTEVIHWSSDAGGIPFCGVPYSRKVLWTIDFRAVTCDACIRAGVPLITKRRLNDR